MPDPESSTPIRSEFASDPDINDCVRQERWDELRRIAHQLKGASGGYGFSPLGEAAAALERDIDAEAELEALRRDAERLIALCGRASV